MKIAVLSEISKSHMLALLNDIMRLLWQVAQQLYYLGSSCGESVAMGHAPHHTVLSPVQALSPKEVWGGCGKKSVQAHGS